MKKPRNLKIRFDKEQFSEDKGIFLRIAPGALVLLFVSWFSNDLYGINGHSLFEILLMSLVVLLLFSTFVVENQIKLAYKYYLYTLLVIFPLSLFLLNASLALILNIYINSRALAIVLTIISLLIFTYTGIRITYTNLINARELNKKSGRLNESLALWNLSAPIYFRSPSTKNNQSRGLALLRWISSIAPFLGIWINRMITGDTNQLFYALLLLFFAYIMFLGIGSNLGIMIYLLIEGKRAL